MGSGQLNQNVRAVHGLDEQFQDLKCPIFLGCQVTASGLSNADRSEAKRLVEKEGGTYSGEMKVKECTHLIINQPKGQKYHFAKKWDIKIVRSEWLYESIEKGFCQEEEGYGLEDGEKGHMHTSTPERTGVSASGISDISNISMISMVNVNETANVTNMTRLEPADPTHGLDLTKVPTDTFLDECKIYLSGFRGAQLERLRKIINAGGGTRFNQVTDNLTHIIVGEPIPADIDKIKALNHRPTVVNCQWLVECYQQEKLAPEAAYISNILPTAKPKTPPPKSNRRESRVQEEKLVTEQVAGNHGDDMEHIMSQYMNNTAQEQPEPAGGSNDTTMAPPMEVQDRGKKNSGPDADNTTACGELECVFEGLTFVLYGFEEESLLTITTYIQDSRGVILQANARRIPDYAVVPIDGFPVDRTVNNIVTNAWIQMCLEQGQLLDVHSNPLFNPLEIITDTQPLQGCVLSVSGYVGTERDTLASIAEVLGAKCQMYFVRAAKNTLLPSTHLIVSAPEGSKYEAAKKWGLPALSKMWLLACAKSGKKVEEEKYLIENVSSDNQMLTQTQTSPNTSRQSAEEKLNQSTGSASSDNQNQSRAPADFAQVKEDNAAPDNDDDDDDTTADPEEIDGANDVSEAERSAIKDGDNDAAEKTRTGEPDISKKSESNIDFTPYEDTDAMLMELNTQNDITKETDTSKADVSVKLDRSVKTTNPLQAKSSPVADLNNQPRSKQVQSVKSVDATKKTDTPPLERFKKKWGDKSDLTGTPILSDKSAFDKLKEMPVPRRNWRYDDWQTRNSTSQKENVATPEPTKAIKELRKAGTSKEEKVTPSKFLNPNVRYIPKFETEEYLKSLVTPEHIRDKRAKEKVKHRNSLDDDALYEVMMTRAEKNIEQRRREKEEHDLLSQRTQDEVDGDVEEVPTALVGVVITVGRRLAKDQSEFNEIVTSLGGEYRWTFDNSCTHFIFQGRQNDTAKDFKQAKANGLKLVSPHWLYMCKEQNVRVDESLFPHTFNPNLSLSVVTKGRTPLRTPRSTRRNARTNMENSAKAMKEPIVISLDNDEKSPVRLISGSSSNKGSNSAGGNSDRPRRGGKSPVKNLVEKMDSPSKSSSDEEKLQPQDTGGSLEMRETLSKHLEDVMAQNKGKKRRTRSKRLNCSGQLSTPEDAVSSGRKTRKTQEAVQDDSGSKGKPSSADGKSREEKNSVEMAPSQSVHVVWDDPMGRLEQEKLALQLERANSPTQDVNGLYDVDPPDAQYSDTDDEEPHPPVPTFQQKQVEEKNTPKQGKQGSNKTPTPDGPTIAFPVNKPARVTPPRPVEMESREEETRPRSPPVIIMSGLDAAERDTYGALVEELGGKVLDCAQFNKACTHLVINKITRNEKFLACIASGKWVLHKSYFDACREAGKFVQEDFYEWGNEGTMSLVKNMESTVRLLASAAHDWRIKTHQQRLKSPECCGAFSSWRVILHCDPGREGSFTRLLAAGGATVLNVKPPYPSNLEATHALVELHKLPLSETDLEKLVSWGCLCLLPEYISGFLCNPDVDIANYVPPQIQELQARLLGTSSKKRKCSSTGVSQKRSKRR
ncbi:DNA topoisomerase 2-binding protein 1-A-like isoform X2 [Mya arenaria]|uniref:DNA topoisomerase 2-binding protein 1-A-like isoform X2 n=1 Tax=Mya arenaria TaxID=6604 RepID=UPI0022E06827|nr:DNA topoisomerase 2-binding protein 1-A-like isoform X2 [Mya arenaria]